MSEQWIDKATKNIVEVHISEIRPGDTILHIDGKIRTVCEKDRTEIALWGFSFLGILTDWEQYQLKNLYSN